MALQSGMNADCGMNAELPAYLLERKLRSLKKLLEDEKSAFQGLTSDISNVVNILELIRGYVRYQSRKLLPENVNAILANICSLDDATDKSLLGRAKVRDRNHLVAWWSNNVLASGLRKFERKIKEIFPAAASGSQWSNPPQPLPRQQPPNDSTNIRRRRCLDWDRDHNLMQTQDQARNDMFSQLVGAGRGKESLILLLKGRRGTGKTTLMRYLYDRVDIIKDYQCRAWISIHENLRYKDVLLEMIGQVGKTGVVIDHMKEEDKLVEELFILLSGFNRYLIVLDDCTPEIWPKLMECLPDKRDGSRVVITTPKPIESFMQNRGHIEPEKPQFASVIQMDELQAEHRWEFLINLVRENSMRESAEELQDRITESSPRASVLLAGALNTQWQDHVQRAVEAVKAHVERAPEQLLSLSVTLDWSYRELHPLIKACFLFLSIFPKGNEVPLRRVRYLWLSEGLLDDDVTNKELAPYTPPRDLARMCFGILVNRKLVEVTKWKLDGSPKACRIPIFVYDFAAKTLEKTSLFDVYNHSLDGALDEGPSVRRLASHPGIEIPRMCMHRHLRTYVSFHNKTGGKLNSQINLHLKTLTEKRNVLLLRLLDLEGVYKPKLPDSIGKLLYLRFLGLRSTLLDALPASTGKLQCLETLDLKHTNITNIPCSLVKSEKLRHLHAKRVPLDAFIPGYCQYHCLPCACPNPQQFSSNLETLTGLYIGGGVNITSSHLFGNLRELEITCDTHNLGTQNRRTAASTSATVIEQLISGMTSLRSLKLNSADTTHQYSLNLSGHRSLEKVYLCCNLEQGGNQHERRPAPEDERPPHPLESRLPFGLRELTLSKSQLKNDPMPILGELDHLVVLRLLGNSYMGTEMKCKRFPRLRVLKLWKLPELVRLMIEPRSMANLEEMEIRRCTKMQKLAGSENLPSTIDVLVLCDMPKNFLKEVKSQQIIQKTTITQTLEESNIEEEPACTSPS